MEEKLFEEWYSRIKSTVEEYTDLSARMAVISGFFLGVSDDTTFTAAQVNKILSLRHTEHRENK